MSLLFQRALGDTNQQLIPPRSRVTQGAVNVSPETAMRASAVWACLMLRANLVSTMPVQSFREVDNYQIDMPLTPFLQNPANDRFGMSDWLFSSQVELDRSGNQFGIIRARDGLGNPSVVELAGSADVQVRGVGPQINTVKIAGTEYDYATEIWHERQFPVAGVPLGLSTIANAAMSVGGYLSAQQFALDWFRSNAIPFGTLKNVNKKLDKNEALITKKHFKAAVAERDLFVHGADWEFNMVQVAANESQFLDTMRYGVVDIARFFGVPGDLIDAEIQHQSKITYANITQRNLQFLIMNLQAPIRRRELALSTTLPRGRGVKFDTDYLLRMDTQTREQLFIAQVAGKVRAPSEVRAADNLPPFTPEQIAEFAALNPPPVAPEPSPTPSSSGGGPND